MNDGSASPIESAEVVLPCTELHGTLAFFIDRLGFRLDTIFPADDPAVAVVSGFGLRLRLQRGAPGGPGVIRLRCRDADRVAHGAMELIAPNGTRIELEAAGPAFALPPLQPALVVTRMGDAASWGMGRAGMQYRDLIGDRQGGRFIASHIRIPAGGPVPDYVHYHDIRLQMIYCYRGWVRVVYEHQGAPFVMRAGDCVLQPPQIRHRVLECADGLEVIEITSPAQHLTSVDHALALPTATLRPEWLFGGQQFVRHEAAKGRWQAGPQPGFESRCLGIGAATRGLAEARVMRYCGTPVAEVRRHDAELLFTFVLAGSLALSCDEAGVHALGAGDAFVVPAGMNHTVADCSRDLELLEVLVPQPAR